MLDDTVALRRCLTALRECQHSELNEIIVADGGTSDECCSIALEFGARYCRSERGRGRQMNRATELASGEWFWFLHADCVPAPESLNALLMCDPREVWGCFRHRIDARSWMLRVIEAMDNLRARALRMPYGDQGVFVRADSFRSVGGFDVVPLLEDVFLARRLAEVRAPIVLKPVLKSDARRWLRNGIVPTMLTNWRIVFEFSVLKKSPEELAALYYKMKA